MTELLQQLDREPNYFFCAMSTCGTLRGCAEVLRDRFPNTVIVGVDATGSKILPNAHGGKRLPGYSAGIVLPFFD